MGIPRIVIITKDEEDEAEVAMAMIALNEASEREIPPLLENLLS